MFASLICDENGASKVLNCLNLCCCVVNGFEFILTAEVWNTRKYAKWIQLPFFEELLCLFAAKKIVWKSAAFKYYHSGHVRGIFSTNYGASSPKLLFEHNFKGKWTLMFTEKMQRTSTKHRPGCSLNKNKKMLIQLCGTGKPWHQTYISECLHNGWFYFERRSGSFKSTF